MASQIPSTSLGLAARVSTCPPRGWKFWLREIQPRPLLRVEVAHAMGGDFVLVASPCRPHVKRTGFDDLVELLCSEMVMRIAARYSACTLCTRAARATSKHCRGLPDAEIDRVVVTPGSSMDNKIGEDPPCGQVVHGKFLPVAHYAGQVARAHPRGQSR